MPNFCTDSNGICLLCTSASCDGGMAVDGNFRCVSGIITACGNQVCTNELCITNCGSINDPNYCGTIYSEGVFYGNLCGSVCGGGGGGNLCSVLSAGDNACSQAIVGLCKLEFYGTSTCSGGAFSVGECTTACCANDFVEGYSNVVCGSGCAAHAEGYENTLFASLGAHVEGAYNCVESSDSSHGEGQCNCVTSDYGHVEGFGNTVVCSCAAHGEGICVYVTGEGAHSEGCCTCSIGNSSHAEGVCSCTCGAGSHAEGCCNITYGKGDHVEGVCTLACSSSCGGGHAEGISTQVDGDAAHAEGWGGFATGQAAHTEGCATNSNCTASHAQGCCTIANANASHAEGYRAKTRFAYQHAAAGGAISHTGDAQFSRYYGQYTAGSNTPANIITITMLSHSTLTFQLILSVYDTTDDIGAGLVANGVVRYTSGATSPTVVGTSSLTLTSEGGLSGATVATSVASPGSFSIQVTGLSGKNLIWQATLLTSEVTSSTP